MSKLYPVDLTREDDDEIYFSPVGNKSTRVFISGTIVSNLDEKNGFVNFVSNYGNGDEEDEDDNYCNSNSICVGPDFNDGTKLKATSSNLIGKKILTVEYHPFRNGIPIRGNGRQQRGTGPVLFLSGKAFIWSVESDGITPGPIWTTMGEDGGDVWEVEK